MVNWVIQRDIFEENIYAITAILSRLNINYKMIEFECLEDVKNITKAFPPGSCVFSYGSIKFINTIRRVTDWQPGYFYNKQDYEFLSLYSHVQDLLLNYSGSFLPKRSVIKTILEKDRAYFVRPNSGDKQFTGEVVEPVFARSWYNDTPGDHNSLCFCDIKRDINLEYRLIISDGQFITGSEYCIDKTTYEPSFRNIDRDNNLIQSITNNILNQIPKDISLDPIYVLDIHEDPHGILKIIEINPISTSSWYACDIEKIIKEINRHAEKEWLDYGY